MRLYLPILLMLFAAAATGQTTRLAAAAPSAVVLEGSSNVTDWRCRGTAVEAEMIVETSASHVIERIEEFTLRIPVSTFRCGNRVMESDMRAALRAKEHPHVEFVLRGLRGSIHRDLDTGVYQAAIAGELSLAGATRPIELTVSASRQSPSVFTFRAELPLRMTAFGVAPPTALFGAIRARDSLVVRFDLVLQIAAEGNR